MLLPTWSTTHFFALTGVIELNDDDSYDECAAKPVAMNDRTRAIFVEEWPNVRARNAITDWKWLKFDLVPESFNVCVYRNDYMQTQLM